MGKIDIVSMKIKSLNNREKTVRVILPYDYDRDTSRRYPVLYMHDGQNLVDPSPYSGYSWDAERIADDLYRQKAIPGIIIVGIDCDQLRRVFEYSGGFDRQAKAKIEMRAHAPIPNFHPEGLEYADFIVSEVKDYIDKTYRTFSDRTHTGIAGSSCGGNISLYMACWHKDIFGIVGAFSPAFWMLKNHLFTLIKNTDLPHDIKIYHDMGTKEGVFPQLTYLRNVHQLQNLLEAKNLDPGNLKLVIEKGAYHTELFWQSRFPDFLKFAFAEASDTK